MKNHPIKKEKLWHQLIVTLPIFLAVCTSYHAFSARKNTSLSSSRKSYERLDIPDFNFNMIRPPSPCPSFRGLSSINTHNSSFFPLNSPPFLSLSGSNMHTPSLYPLNSPSFLPSSRNLSHGTDTDSVKKKWFEAVTKDDLSTLRDILSNYIFDADEVSQKGNTAFLIACERQNKEIASYLLNIGASKFVRNNDGHTAFHLTCIYGHKALAAWLLTLGLSKYTLDYQGNNALDLVHLYGCHAKQEMCAYLLSIGLQTKAVRRKSQLPPLMANHSRTSLFAPADPFHYQRAISVPIHGNALAGEEKEKNRVASSVPPFPMATQENRRKKFLREDRSRSYVPQIARLNGSIHLRFPQQAENLQNQDPKETNVDGRQEKGRKELVTEEERDSWFTAVAENDLEEVKRILENCLFDIDLTNAGGNSAFFIACDVGHQKMAKYLLKAGANRYATDNDGWTALHMSCTHGDKNFTSWLLSVGLDPHAKTHSGNTAFHLACICDHKVLAAWLLTLGLSKDAIDHEGNNALDLAKLYNASQEVCNYLLSIGLQTKDMRESNQIQPSTSSPSVDPYTFSGQEESDEESSASSSACPSSPSMAIRKTKKKVLDNYEQTSNTSVHDNMASSDEDEEIKDTPAVTLVPIPMSKRSKKKFPCLYCPKGYARKESLAGHVFFHTDLKSVTCPICKKVTASKASLVSHLIMHKKKDRPYGCSHCSRYFKTSSDLGKHVRTHNSEKIYECNECYKRFSKKYNLKMHIKGVHQEERPFKCTICPKAFKRKAHLQAHLKKIHSIKPKIHVCKDCAEEFSSPYELKRHRCTHTGKDTPICPTCSKPFSSVSSMRTHQRKFHPEEKYHVCQDCDEKFKLFSELRRHQCIHTEKTVHICPTCEKSFSSTSNMRTHQRRLHPEEEHYVCQDCAKEFDLPSELKRHRRIHTGEDNHICPTCKQSFSSKGNLKRHIHRKHRSP